MANPRNAATVGPLSQIPTPTLDDEGTYLAVVNGVPTWASVSTILTQVVGAVNLGGDVYVVTTDETPVDYTDGTPPATGEGVYGTGTLLIFTDDGTVYRNSGTKAQPAWTLLADEA